MTKRELRKEAYNRIIKEGNTHQEAFDAMQSDKSFSKEEIAENLSKIPSKAVIERVKIWKIAFITVLAIIILMRILGITLITSVMPVNSGFSGAIGIVWFSSSCNGYFRAYNTSIRRLKRCFIPLYFFNHPLNTQI